MGSQPISTLLGKILWEILVGKSCGTGKRGKSQFKKSSDKWKFSIWNRVMGSQPIRIQLGKIFRKILREILAGNSCGKILWEILVGSAAGNAVGNLVEKVLMVRNRSKNGKKTHQHRQFLAHAGNFLAHYNHQNIIKLFLSCRGGSKLRFGGSYVKIG